jgi:phosphoribosylaminoimidazolecarboxamide formyltransferase/IMP cyclohydrolase
MNQQPEPPKVLFLCTGNFYRSRFAALLFNALAAEAGLNWRAFSRGLATERGIHNVGPISPNAVRGLEARGIALAEPIRFPLQAREEDWRQADLMIAIKEEEHRPLVEERFALWADKVEYWQIDDVEQAPPGESLAKMDRLVGQLIRRLAERSAMAGNIVERVDDWIQIKRVLVSVSDKSGLEMLVPALVEINPGIHFYSTGGTYQRLAQIMGTQRAARHLTQVSDYTGQPETQGGLVKTLDFKIYLGLLTETYNDAHQADLARSGAVPLDMVVCNLYPFEATVARAGVRLEEGRANIDIGGPSMIRAAAKNYLRVAPVVDPADYGGVVAFLGAHEGALNLVKRFELARKAFAYTARYDAAISQFLAEQDTEAVPRAYTLEAGARRQKLSSTFQEG